MQTSGMNKQILQIVAFAGRAHMLHGSQLMIMNITNTGQKVSQLSVWSAWYGVKSTLVYGYDVNINL